MRKLIFTLFAAGSLVLSNSATDVEAAFNSKSEVTAQASAAQETTQEIEQVASSKATAKSGTYKFKYNTNVRTDAGTKNKIVMTAKNGATATATHQKKVGKETWYKVKVGSKTGWVLSTLVTKTTVKKAASTSSKATAKSGTFKFNANTNVRTGAGTNNKIVITAKKGATATASQQKKVGSATWYKIKTGSKTGWVLSTLVTPTTVKKATTSSKKGTTSKATAKSGTFKFKSNTNVRTDAGTNNKIVVTAKKGATAVASQQKKVGSATWYKVKTGSKTGWVLSTLLTTSTVKKASSSVSNSSVVSTALSLQGIPYVFGGTTTKGFDCSGFIQYVFKKTGKNVSRTTLSQYAETKKVSSPKPGDLVFFAGTYRAGISHVGIYIGNNQFVHAGGAKSEVRSLSENYWKSHFHSYRSF